MKVRKVVIPVAGLGTRLLPASKAIPKEMIPVLDKPLIQHVIEEAAIAGIEHVILVTRAGKESIENHFDSHYELESELEKKGKFDPLRSVQNTLPRGVTIESVRQPGAHGLGHAIHCASVAVHDEPFAVILPDVLVVQKDGSATNDLKKMISAYEVSGASQIMVEEVPNETVERYGVTDCHGVNLEPGKSAPIYSLVEKPKPAEAPSNLAVVGRYVLDPKIMPILGSTDRGAGNEVQLTDGLDTLLQSHPVAAYRMAGETYDCGDRFGLLEASIQLGLVHPSYKRELRSLIKRLSSQFD